MSQSGPGTGKSLRLRSIEFGAGFFRGIRETIAMPASSHFGCAQCKTLSASRSVQAAQPANWTSTLPERVEGWSLNGVEGPRPGDRNIPPKLLLTLPTGTW